MIEHIHALQQEIIDTRAREADNEITIKDLKIRIQVTSIVICENVSRNMEDPWNFGR